LFDDRRDLASSQHGVFVGFLRAHLVFLKRLGATHLSTHPHMSKY
jgi:hypothetical protein